jgi:hypothetical protein
MAATSSGGPDSRLYRIGQLLYAISFLLIAVQTTGGGGFSLGFGFICAFGLLGYPWAAAKALLHPSVSVFLHYFANTISGLINPLFLFSLPVPPRWVRNALLIMMPFCWIVFLFEHLYPREGYFLWTTGILMVLYAVRAAEPQPTTPSVVAKPGVPSLFGR